MWLKIPQNRGQTAEAKRTIILQPVEQKPHSQKYSGHRRREKERVEKSFEGIIVENFPNMRKEIVTEVQEAQRVPYRFNPRRNTPRHILIKLTKIKFKEKILKAARGHLQDGGGVGESGVHLSPQMHQEYIYKWNNSHRALAEH